MTPNKSPWIHQLNRTRDIVSINEDQRTDITIVGGGIAGITTAYFLLRDTERKILLLEADKIAHGATGHNAGQITPYFEKPLADIVNEFGLDMAIRGQASIESGWTLIDEIYEEAKLKTPCYRFTGYDAISSGEQVLLELKNNYYRTQGGLRTELIIIDEKSDVIKAIPEEHKDLYVVTKKSDLLDLLETNCEDYICAVSYQKGCMNSALFCEELLEYLILKYRDRFSFYEGSPVTLVRLKENNAELNVVSKNVTTEKVILCTNGFENFNIINDVGKEIDVKFHHSINGRIGYMAGYIEPMNGQPTATSYFPRNKQAIGDPLGEPYFYLTRRPHDYKQGRSHNLICAGGPEVVLPNHANYSRDEEYAENHKYEITELLKETYKNYSSETEFSFYWHGLMGYTPNGIRRVGEEPINPTLIYNLGCNGIGILPSIYGAKRIAQIINGEKLEKSIFDPGSTELL